MEALMRWEHRDLEQPSGFTGICLAAATAPPNWRAARCSKPDSGLSRASTHENHMLSDGACPAPCTTYITADERDGIRIDLAASEGSAACAAQSAGGFPGNKLTKVAVYSGLSERCARMHLVGASARSNWPGPLGTRDLASAVVTTPGIAPLTLWFRAGCTDRRGASIHLEDIEQ